MQLHLLFRTPSLTAYHDLRNDWLFLDWEGDTTLATVQEACLALGNCLLHRPYAHILNSNEQVTGVSWSVAAWLATDFLPHMALAGIEHVAWVYSPTLRGQNMVQTVLNWLPGPLITTFSDVADAAAWLQQLPAKQPQAYPLPVRPPATQAKLATVVQELSQRIVAKQRKAELV